MFNRIRYHRASIKRASFHENLFSIFLEWEATFEPFLNYWFWTCRPRKDGAPIQVIDIDTTRVNCLTEEHRYGIIVKISSNIWRGNMLNCEHNPIDESFMGFIGQRINQIKEGRWVIPPTSKGFKLNVENIQDGKYVLKSEAPNGEGE